MDFQCIIFRPHFRTRRATPPNHHQHASNAPLPICGVAICFSSIHLFVFTFRPHASRFTTIPSATFYHIEPILSPNRFYIVRHSRVYALLELVRGAKSTQARSRYFVGLARVILVARLFFFGYSAS